MPSKIFISYRKDDSRWHTQALYNELLKYFPKNSIFKDFNTIGLGEDYRESINKALEQCEVLLVMIGKHWLEIKNKEGKVRLQETNDLVRIEINTALKRNIKVVPVLFDNIDMFQEKDLPNDLQALTLRQFISVSDIKFEADVRKLADEIKRIIALKDLSSNPDKETRKEERANILPPTAASRWHTSLIMGLIGGVFSGSIFFTVDAFEFYGNYTETLFLSSSLKPGLIAGIIWMVAGAIAGPRRNFIQTAVVSSIVAFLAWMAIVGFSDDNVRNAATYVMPLAAILGVLIRWLVLKIHDL